MSVGGPTAGGGAGDLDGTGEEAALQLEVARRYYYEDESKVAIAQALGLSRFQVARLLQEARRNGLVRIEIGSPGRLEPETSAAVRDRLGIEEAVIVEADPTSPEATIRFVARALAATVVRHVAEGDVLGMTWSRATVLMASHLAGLRPCTVVQLAGAVVPPDGLPGSVELTRLVAAAGGGSAVPVYAPLVVPDSATAAGLRRQPEVAATMRYYDRIDVAVLSIGAWRPSASAVFDLVPRSERQRLARSGACGEVSGRLFDTAGAPVPEGIDDRVIGVTVEQLRGVPRLVTSSCGRHRKEATLGAVRSGLVHTLVADDGLARALLE